MFVLSERLISLPYHTLVRCIQSTMSVLDYGDAVCSTQPLAPPVDDVCHSALLKVISSSGSIVH